MSDTALAVTVVAGLPVPGYLPLLLWGIWDDWMQSTPVEVQAFGQLVAKRFNEGVNR